MCKAILGVIIAGIIFIVLSAIWAVGHIFVGIVGALIVVACTYKSESLGYAIIIGLVTLVAFPFGMGYFLIDKLGLFNK